MGVRVNFPRNFAFKFNIWFQSVNHQARHAYVWVEIPMWWPSSCYSVLRHLKIHPQVFCTNFFANFWKLDTTFVWAFIFAALGFCNKKAPWLTLNRGSGLKLPSLTYTGTRPIVSNVWKDACCFSISYRAQISNILSIITARLHCYRKRSPTSMAMDGLL